MRMVSGPTGFRQNWELSPKELRSSGQVSQAYRMGVEKSGKEISGLYSRNSGDQPKGTLFHANFNGKLPEILTINLYGGYALDPHA